MEIDATGEIAAASDADGMMRKRRAASANSQKRSVKSTSSISADGGVESSDDIKDTPWFKEKETAEKILQDGVGSAASDSDNGLLDAVSKESQGTSAAPVAAANMVQAIKKKTADLLKTTQSDVNNVVDSTRQVVTNEQQHAVNHLDEAEQKRETTMQNILTEAKTKMAVAQEPKASRDEKDFSAMNASAEASTDSSSSDSASTEASAGAGLHFDEVEKHKMALFVAFDVVLVVVALWFLLCFRISKGDQPHLLNNKGDQPGSDSIQQ